MEELGLNYDLAMLKVGKCDQNTPEFRAVHPKGKVPALVRDDDSVLTEFSAIAMWLAKIHPEAGLLPKDLETEIRTQEPIYYVVASLHLRGATLTMTPGRFVQNQEGQELLAKYGRDTVHAGLEKLAERLGDHDYSFSDVSIADAAVFYLLQWRERANLDMPAALQKFDARMKARPAVQRAWAV